jgi:hypothetical protein
MKRYTVSVRATATTNVIVEAQSEEEALKLAEARARQLKSRFLWGYEKVVAARIRPYAWDHEQELAELSRAQEILRKELDE